MTSATLADLADLPGFDAAVDRVRTACAGLSLLPRARRQHDLVVAESRVRGARASASLEGAQVTAERVLQVMAGQVADPVDAVVAAALRVTSAARGAATLVGTAPAQALARLHLAAATGLVDDPDLVGRPRRPMQPVAELGDLGPPEDPQQTLRRLTDLLRAPAAVPALAVLAAAHAELACGRPFAVANGLLARALDRVVLAARGLDADGLAVPEFGHAAGGAGAYVADLAAYRRGDWGVWLDHCATAVVRGAAEARAAG
ncbi:MAG TPA: hypothetical protein VFJ97_00055 [Dermatophilaceae bacterium]|nr:hypothetical protein [Dermatophilaceae bacterium]